MENWLGAAGVCINDNNELLMVLQGTPEEDKTWSVPSGTLEANESFAECCKREFEEETGYVVKIIKPLMIKECTVEEINNLHIEVHYFLVEIIGGNQCIRDPDKLIYDIAWKTQEDIQTLNLSYPEDSEILLDLLNRSSV